MLVTWNERHIGEAELLKRFHGPASAGAVDHADERQSEFMRHLLGGHELAVNGGVGGAAAHSEIVRRGHDRTAVDAPATEDEIDGEKSSRVPSAA